MEWELIGLVTRRRKDGAGEMDDAEMLHEGCSKGCSGVGHFEGVDRHGYAADDLTGVSLLQTVAFWL